MCLWLYGCSHLKSGLCVGLSSSGDDVVLGHARLYCIPGSSSACGVCKATPESNVDEVYAEECEEIDKDQLTHSTAGIVPRLFDYGLCFTNATGGRPWSSSSTLTVSLVAGQSALVEVVSTVFTGRLFTFTSCLCRHLQVFL